MGTEGRYTAARPEYAEKHYTVAEVAAMWMLSADVVRRMFEFEPDVLVPKGGHRKIRRSHRTSRIPALERVHKRLTTAA